MGIHEEAQSAINALNHKDMDGRALIVEEVDPKQGRGRRKR
jgi:RNA recognition motif-containing protein